LDFIPRLQLAAREKIGRSVFSRLDWLERHCTEQISERSPLR
jgi:hypothetical protein